MVELGRSGASSWIRVLPSPTASIASRTPCSALTSSCTLSMPNVLGVEGDRRVQVGHRDADMIDRAGMLMPPSSARRPGWQSRAWPGS